MPKVSTAEEFEAIVARLHTHEYQFEKEQPFKFVLIEDSHVEGQSVLLLPVHHTFGDGIVWVSVLNAAAENGFAGLAQLQHGEEDSMWVELAGLKFGINAFMKVLANYNPFMKQPEIVNHRYLFSENLAIGRMKAACKKFNMPLQPTIFALVSQALHEYYQRRNIKVERMPIPFAYSLLPIPRNKDEIRSGNNIVSVTGDLMITDNLKANLKQMKPPDLIHAKGKYYLALFLTSLPFGLGKKLLSN